MNLRDLRYIVAVADFGHFGRAAAACNVSQPTLSGQIRKLEEELGLAVFERVGRSVRPTPAGAQILLYARNALAAADDIGAVAQRSRDPLAGPFHLGVIPTLGPYLMPYVLPGAKQALAAMRLVLVEDLTMRLIELVGAGKLDAAIIASDPETPGLSVDPLFDEDFWLVLPQGHALSRKNRIDVSEINSHDLLLLTDGHCLRDQALDLCGNPPAGDAIADMRATSSQNPAAYGGGGLWADADPDLGTETGTAPARQPRRAAFERNEGAPPGAAHLATEPYAQIGARGLDQAHP